MIVGAGGWCAPSETVYDPLWNVVYIEPELWSPYLLPEDVEWIVRSIAAAEIDIDAERWYDLQAESVRRGGIRFESS